MRNDEHDDAIDAAAPQPTPAPAAGTAEGASENFRKLPIPADRLNEPAADLAMRQRTAIELLAIGKSVGAVAKACGVSPRTLYTWRQDESFRAELSQRHRELWSQAAARLRAMVHPSLDILERHLFDPYDRSRFRAATAVLRLADLRKVVPPAEQD